MCSKLSVSRSVGDIALNPSLRAKINMIKATFLRHRINLTCKFFITMYTLIILIIRLSA